ncbi:MAG: ABC transporter permease [Actinobacteria bacterium 13_2_20CM_2_66_6]|nr:MAG: ABC transporter permease [Actinobacteria bacterium 13_2_20CM_2_66_6]
MSALSAASRNEPARADETSTSASRARAQARANRRILVNGLRVAFAVIVLGVWEVGTMTDPAHKDGLFIDPFFYGRPSGIASQLWTWIQNGTAQGPLWLQVATTLEEAFLGFLIGVVLGVVFGVALGRVRLLSDVFAPYIKALNAMPRVVLGSIFIITIGYGIWSKVALAVVLVFFVVFFNAFQGVREVDRVLVANARILGASERQLSTHVILPSALSWILASLHTSFGFALVGAVVGEYLGAIHGIGLIIATAQATFNPNGVFAAMFILAVVALTAEVALTWLEGRLIKWRPNAVTDVRI